jgi:hypothetical protein
MNTQPQASSVPSVASVPSESRELTLAKKAIAYTLQRIKSEPNIGYHMGFGTEVFERLTQAAAALFGEPLKTVQEKFAFRDTGRMPAARAIREINNAYQEYIGGYDQSDSARDTLVTTLGEILRKTE